VTRNLVAFISGVVFAVGLAFGGMLHPRAVIGFLDVASWDPRLLFVMGGAIAVMLPAYRLLARRGLQHPDLPIRDPRLFAGAVLFGIGWALVGYCPGPALVAVGATAAGFGGEVVIPFVLAMGVGMLAHRGFAAATRGRSLGPSQGACDA